jgi:hypothetical protein
MMLFFRTNASNAAKMRKKSLPKKKEVENRRKKDDNVMASRRALEALYTNFESPVVSGLLMNFEQTFMESSWRQRYVVLDPKIGNLSFWSVKAGKSKRQLEALRQSTAPSHVYPLNDLMSMEANEYHHTLMLNFCKPGSPRQLSKSLTLQANEAEDFDRWVEALSRYGMKEKTYATAACAA